jgi:hypothetical protein
MDGEPTLGPVVRYADFKRLQEAHDWRRRGVLLAVAAGILLAIAVTGWALLHKRNENLLPQTAILDLRNYSLPRGGEASPRQPAREVSRNATELTILLPFGTSEGPYDVRIATLSGEERTEASGKAVLRGGVTSLHIALPLGSLRRGQSLIRHPQSLDSRLHHLFLTSGAAVATPV